MIKIHDKLMIPLREIEFVFGTSSGPGGQHANKVETKVTLRFNVTTSKSINTRQQNKIFEKLSTRVNKKGVLRVASSKYRSQKANRKAVIEKFSILILEALKTQKPRKKTRISRMQKRKRLDQKKKRGEKKRLRSKVQPHA